MDIFHLFIKLTIITILKIADIGKNLKNSRNELLSHLWSLYQKKYFYDFQFYEIDAYEHISCFN